MGAKLNKSQLACKVGVSAGSNTLSHSKTQGTLQIRRARPVPSFHSHLGKTSGVNIEHTYFSQYDDGIEGYFDGKLKSKTCSL